MAARNQNDARAASDSGKHAHEALARLEQMWGAQEFNSYVGRSDIKSRRDQIQQLREAPLSEGR